MAHDIKFFNIDLLVYDGMPICVPMLVADDTIVLQAFLLDDPKISSLVKEWGDVANVVVSIGDLLADDIVDNADFQNKKETIPSAYRGNIDGVLRENYKLLRIRRGSRSAQDLWGIFSNKNASRDLFHQFLVTLSESERHIAAHREPMTMEQRRTEKKFSSYVTYVSNTLRSEAVAASEPDYIRNVADELSSYFLHDLPYAMIRALTSHSFSVIVLEQYEMRGETKAFLEALVEWASQHNTVVHVSRQRDATTRLQGEITVFKAPHPLPQGIISVDNIYGEGMATKMTSELGYLEICCDFKGNSHTFEEFVSGISGGDTKQSLADFLTTRYLLLVRKNPTASSPIPHTVSIEDHVQLVRRCWQRRVHLNGGDEMNRFQLVAINSLHLNDPNSPLNAMPLFATIDNAPNETPGLLIGYILETAVDDLVKAFKSLGVTVTQQDIVADDCDAIAATHQNKVYISKHTTSIVSQQMTRVCPNTEMWSRNVSWPESIRDVFVKPNLATHYGTMRLYVGNPEKFNAFLIVVQMALGSLLVAGSRTKTLK